MFGSHLSIAGGICNALTAAERLNCQTVQIFTGNPRSWKTSSPPLEWTGKIVHRSSEKDLTKNQKQWKFAPLEPAAIDEWTSHCKRINFAQTVSHDSYLINLASPSDEAWRKSVELFIEEVNRCGLLGIPYLVTHPGAHMGEGEAAGIDRIVAAMNVVLDATKQHKNVTVCLEATAGQGSSIGHQLEHLAEIIDCVDSPKRFGVCLDTAHLFAAGYDFRGRKYTAFRKQLDKTVGLARVKVLHLNDSKKDLGSRVDRHEHIGRGLIGVEGFKPWVRDEAFRDVPKILETEKGVCPDTKRDWDVINLEVLRGLA